MFSQLKAVVKSLQKAKPKKKPGEVCTEIHKRVLETNKIKDYSIAYISLYLPSASSCLAQGLHYIWNLLTWSSGFPRPGFRAQTLCVFVYLHIYS